MILSLNDWLNDYLPRDISVAQETDPMADTESTKEPDLSAVSTDMLLTNNSFLLTSMEIRQKSVFEIILY